eukprot:1175919-Prorocentrum_minimum.AAC.2
MAQMRRGAEHPVVMSENLGFAFKPQGPLAQTFCMGAPNSITPTRNLFLQNLVPSLQNKRPRVCQT